MTVQHADQLELIYSLSRHPQRISTFVNGEVAVLAPRVGSLRIVAQKRSEEPELRPGGIPADVDVRWTPKRGEGAFWEGTARALRHPRRYADELASVAAPVTGFTARRRWAYSAAAAMAYAARLPAATGPRHIHAHFASTGAVIAHAMAHLLAVPYSVTVHGSADLFRDNPHLDLLLSDAAAVIAVSAYHRRIILERVPGLDPDLVHVIHIGVPSERLARAAGEILPRTAGAPAHIVSVASLVPPKGMSVLIEAMARLVRAGRAITLDIYGDGPLRGAMEEQIDELGITKVVRMHGAVTPDAAHAAMRTADLFTLASVRTPEGAQDGVPTVLMEAMASGTPVVSTRLSGIPELVLEGETGWLAAPNDADELAAAIGRALDDPMEARRRALRAREHVSREFDQEQNALALLDVILSDG